MTPAEAVYGLTRALIVAAGIAAGLIGSTYVGADRVGRRMWPDTPA